MSYSVNRAEVLGNWTDQPELRYTKNGTAVASGTIATNREWFDKDLQERKSVAEFHRVVFWDKPAEIVCQIAKKGDKVWVTGRMQTRDWEDKNGVKRYMTEIVVQDFVLLTPRKVEEEVEPPVEAPEGVRQNDQFDKDVEETFEAGEVPQEKVPEEKPAKKGKKSLSEQVADDVEKGLSGDIDDIPF